MDEFDQESGLLSLILRISRGNRQEGHLPVRKQALVAALKSVDDGINFLVVGIFDAFYQGIKRYPFLFLLKFNNQVVTPFLTLRIDQYSGQYLNS